MDVGSDRQAGRWIARRALLLVSLAVVMAGSNARAHGALWSAQGAVEHTGVDVLLVDHPGAGVTAIVQVHHDADDAGPLMWVIPVRGEPTVRTSARTVFQRLEAATAPQYWLEVDADGCDTPAAVAPGVAQAGPLSGGAVAPRRHVTVAGDPSADDPTDAAFAALEEQGYDTAGLDADVLRPYLEDGYRLLAIELDPPARGEAIRPIMLRHESDELTIPVGAAGEPLELRIWVVGPTQAVPLGDRSLVINDARIDWLSARPFTHGTLPQGGAGPAGDGGYRPQGYDALLAAAVAEADGRGFVTELAGPSSQYREKLWWSVAADQLELVTGGDHADGVEAITAARDAYANWDGFRAAVEAATELGDDVTLEAFMDDPDSHREAVTVDMELYLERLRQDVVGPVSEAGALLSAGPYLTYLHGRIGGSDAARDPTLGYNYDLAQVNQVHVAGQQLDCGGEAANYQVQTPQGAVVAGDRDWPAAAAAMPANLKVVGLSSEGAGEVVADNREAIAVALSELGGGTARRAAQPPRDGVTIGGSQSVAGYVPQTPSSTTAMRLEEDVGYERCAISVPGRGRAGGGVLALWLLIAGALYVRRPRRGGRWLALVGLSLLLACGSDGEPSVGAPGSMEALTLDELRDPETCKECHPAHYQEWSSSMHAYAAMDPVFLAMNRRGQRETDGELGDFCVQCHAPMAVVDGLTHDGLNLEELPDLERGVSCYYCHNVVAIEDDHNAQLRLANDTVMRGPYADAITPPVHGVAYSELFDEGKASSADMCGACHDIVTPSGVRLERTYQEYLTSVYSKVAEGDPRPFETCVSCHMHERQGFAADVPGAPRRMVHEHLWPGVDLAVVDFPNRDAMRAAVEDCQLAQSITFFTLEVTPPDLFTFQIETAAGHNQPSGAAQDRRMWLELLAYDEDGELIEELSSGNIADDELEEWPEGHEKHDPNLLMFRDRTFDADGKPVHMFWEAEPSEAYPDGHVSQTLPPATTTYLRGKHAQIKQYRLATADGELPARVTARLRVRPIGRDVLQDLVDSGDLDPAVRDAMQTLTVGPQIEWTPQDGMMKPVEADERPADCSSYVCMLHGDAACE